MRNRATNARTHPRRASRPNSSVVQKEVHASEEGKSLAIRSVIQGLRLSRSGASYPEGVLQQSPGFPPPADTLGEVVPSKFNPERVVQIVPSVAFEPMFKPPVVVSDLRNPFRVRTMIDDVLPG